MNKRIFVFLFACSFLVFILNGTSIGTADSIPASVLPFNILSGHGVYFDQYYSLLKNTYSDMYFFRQFHDHYISSWPLVSGLLAIPVYIPFYLFLKAHALDSLTNLYNYSFILEKLSASLIAAFSVALFYRLLYLISKKSAVSILFALIFGFATQTYSISSQALWQHGTANLFLIASLISVVKKNGLLALVCAGLAFASRNTFILFFLPVWVFLIAGDKRHRVGIIALGLAVLGLVTSYSLHFFGSILNNRINTFGEFDLTNIVRSFAGLFFSPSRGVLFYTPFYIFSFCSLLFISKIKNITAAYTLFLLNLVYFISGIFLYSLFDLWWGGASWGNRYFTDLAVPAVLLSYVSFVYIQKTIFKYVFLVLVLYCLGIQILGVINYPSSHWDSYPGFNARRFWDVQDNPIARSLAVGPDLSGADRLIHWFTGADKNRMYFGPERKCSLRLSRRYRFLGYMVLSVVFKNESAVDWYTVGNNPFASTLTIKQVFVNGDNERVVSPLVPAAIPSVIKKGQSVTVTLLVLPPGPNFQNVLILPAQNDVFWQEKGCQLFT